MRVTERAAQGRGIASWLGVLIAASGGVLWAVQAKMNAQLGVELGDPIASAASNFIGAAALMLVAAAAQLRKVAVGVVRLRTALARREISPLTLLTGFIGMTICLSQVFIVDLVGIAAFTVSVVAGSAIAAIVIDASGLGPDGRVRISRLRIAGAVVLVIAVALVAFGRGGLAGLAAATVLGLGAALVTGALVALQTAVTGALTVASGSIIVAMLLVFVTGAVLFTTIRVFLGPLTIPPDVSWIFAIAGPLSAVFVATAAVLASRMSLLLLSAAIVIGQTSGATVIDLVFPTEAGRPGWMAAFGVALTVAAVIIIGSASRPKPSQAQRHADTATRARVPT